MRENNLQESADAMTLEAQLTNQYEVCDNIDLDIILQDYQSYYFTKFNKMPKIVKKLSNNEAVGPKVTSQSQKVKHTSA